jgi:dienelactone hydrolase
MLANEPSRYFARVYESVARSTRTPYPLDLDRLSIWQTHLRALVTDRLGVSVTPRPAPAFQVTDVTDQQDHIRSLLTYETERGVPVRTWILTPKDGPGRRPAVIAVHGHGTGVNDIVGLMPNGSTRTEPAGLHQDFALALVRRGFIVAAPEMLGFGERRQASDIELGDDVWSCRSLATWALMLGTTLIGRRVADLVRLVDLLESRDDVEPTRIGLMGISGGATAALFTAGLDERVAATVLSGYVSSYRSTVLISDQCLCNVVPGIVAAAEHADLAMLIAPRPQLLEAGRADPIAPFFAVEEAARELGLGYAALEAKDRFEVDVFDGGHVIHGERAYDFLEHWLGAPDASA